MHALVVALKKQLFTNYKAMYSESMQYIIHVSVSIYIRPTYARPFDSLVY